MNESAGTVVLALRWTAAWAVMGLLAGLAMMLGDTGHFPLWLLPPLVTLAGAVSGALALALFLAVRRLLGQTLCQFSWLNTALAAVTGALTMYALASPLGLRSLLAVAAGAVAGLVSGGLSARELRR